MAQLNDNHKQHLLSAFRVIDQRLGEILGLLNPDRGCSPFSDYVPDATPLQHRVVADHVTRIRASMRRILTEQGVILPPPSISSVWAARTGLLSAEIDLEELRPRSMRGYGELPEGSAQQLDAMVMELRTLFETVGSFLAQGPGRELRARMQRLEATVDSGKTLAALERAITDYGLVEFRSPLTMLVERIESPALQVPVCGGVSAGKSSLLNHLLGADVLPVGVTPVTALPTRIAHGPSPRATIAFAEARAITVEPGRLVEFVSEQQNPGNAKRVGRIVLELPAEILRDGVVFVDTPGLGALATTGAAESLAYLPRCDLGLVLVDAASALSTNDLTLVQTLLQAGAKVMVLLSKADLLSEDERRRAADYARQQLASNLGFELPVFLVSVRGPSTALCDQWATQTLLPYLREGQANTERSLRRKIGALRQAVVSALKQRAGHAEQSPTTRTTHHVGQFESVVARALLRLDAPARQDPPLRPAVEAVVEQAVEESSQVLARQWPAKDSAVADVTEPFVAALAAALRPHVNGILQDISHLRAELKSALCEAARLAGATDRDVAPLPEARNVPSLESCLGSLKLQLKRPALAFISRLARHSLRVQMLNRHGDQVRAALERYAKAVEAWRQASLASLRQPLTAAADLLRARLSPPESAPQTDAAASQRLHQAIAALELLALPEPPTARSNVTGVADARQP